MLEKSEELSKENGKDDTKLRDFAARFNRLDAAVQLQQGAGSLETAQLEHRAAVEAKDEETAKNGLAKLHELIVEQQIKCADVLKLKVGKPDVWNPDKTPFSEWDHRWLNNLHYKVIFPAWRTSGEVAPVDGDQKMPSSGSGFWRLHQWKWPLMHILPKISRPRGRVWHLLTQWHRRCQSDSCSNKMSRLRRRENCTGWCDKICVCGRGDGITLTEVAEPG